MVKTLQLYYLSVAYLVAICSGDITHFSLFVSGEVPEAPREVLEAPREVLEAPREVPEAPREVPEAPREVQ